MGEGGSISEEQRDDSFAMDDERKSEASEGSCSVSENAVLRTIGLRRSFGRNVAVDGLDLSVREGEIYGFLGVNGAGKTTTIRMVMGITVPDGGEVELFGERNRRASIAQKQRIGYVSQEQYIYPWMNAKVLGKFVGGLYPTWDQAEYQRLLELFGIPARRRFSALSGGMKMKLALSLALAPRPELLVLDEPTAGLDPVARREFLDIVKAQAKHHGRTTFFSTHLLDEVEKVADRVGIVHEGKMRYEGRLEGLRQRVRRVVFPRAESVPPEVPSGFERWKNEDLGEGETGWVLQGEKGVWDTTGWPGGARVELLPLDDIFIACAGVEVTEI